MIIFNHVYQKADRKVFPPDHYSPNSLSDDKFTKEIIAYWREVFSDLIHWYDLADSKCVAIITISGIMLSFVTLGSFLDARNNMPQIYSKNIVAFYILLLFLFSVMSSVILAVLLME